MIDYINRNLYLQKLIVRRNNGEIKIITAVHVDVVSRGYVVDVGVVETPHDNRGEKLIQTVGGRFHYYKRNGEVLYPISLYPRQ